MGNAFKLAQIAWKLARRRRLERREPVAAEPGLERLKLRRLKHGVAHRLAAAPANRLADRKCIAARHYGFH